MRAKLSGTVHSGLVYVGGEGTGYAMSGVSVPADFAKVQISGPPDQVVTALGTFEEKTYQIFPGVPQTLSVFVAEALASIADPIPAGRVRLTGLLRTGLVHAGGSGPSAELRGVAFDVDPKALAPEADALNGQKVLASGTFATRSYVERGDQSTLELDELLEYVDDPEVFRDCIILGNGGGFTGRYTENIVTRSGRVYVRESGPGTPGRLTSVGPARDVSSVFAAMDAIDFRNIPTGAPGNMTTWLERRTPSWRHTVQWEFMATPKQLRVIVSEILTVVGNTQ